MLSGIQARNNSLVRTVGRGRTVGKTQMKRPKTCFPGTSICPLSRPKVSSSLGMQLILFWATGRRLRRCTSLVRGVSSGRRLGAHPNCSADWGRYHGREKANRSCLDIVLTPRKICQRAAPQFDCCPKILLCAIAQVATVTFGLRTSIRRKPKLRYGQSTNAPEWPIRNTAASGPFEPPTFGRTTD